MTILFIVSIIAATIGAISGVGGGVLIKPVLDAVTDLPVTQISFMSSCTVLTMTSVSLLRSKKRGVQIDKKRGTALAVGAAVGGVLGKQLFNLSVKDLLGESTSKIQAGILAVLCVLVFVYTLRKDIIERKNIQSAAVCFGLGIMLGTMSSFLGIGGGPIDVMAISFFLSMDSKTTAVHSLYAIFFSQLFSILFSVVSGTVPTFDIPSLLLMIAGGVGGAFVGGAFSKRMSNKHVDKVFLSLLIVVVGISCYNMIK